PDGFFNESAKRHRIPLPLVGRGEGWGWCSARRPEVPRMKAIVARAFAPIEALEYADWPEPVAGPRDIVIEAEAIGVNFPDGLLVQGLYQVKPPAPFVPGMEIAGKVVAVGKAVRSVKEGDRVAAVSSLGAYAEKVGVPERVVMKLPEGMD